jgi:hypothetical protein
MMQLCFEIYYTAIDKKEFNSQAKSYFDELFLDKDNGGYIYLLAEIFPYVKKYRGGQELESDNYYVSDNEYPNIAKNKECVVLNTLIYILPIQRMIISLLIN